MLQRDHRVDIGVPCMVQYGPYHVPQWGAIYGKYKYPKTPLESSFHVLLRSFPFDVPCGFPFSSLRFLFHSFFVNYQLQFSNMSRYNPV